MCLLQCVHCDICRPLPASYRNFSYFILFIDCFSQFTSHFLMKSCNEALQLFVKYQAVAENFCKKRIAILHVDNAPKLIQGQMEAHCKTSGITYKKTVPDLPPQNRVAECVNRTICSMAHVMLIDTDLCDYFWPFAILTAAHTKQRTPNASLPPNTMPFQLWFHHRADIFHLRLFRSCCIAQVISNNLSKFDTCSESGRFLRYAKGMKSYVIWVPNQNNNGAL